ncbi:hypothetical protein J1614_006226 [Plenodomus biglobosus]|nr:hypothetical protein J1614_006226 [Plenodomus biglobosus]
MPRYTNHCPQLRLWAVFSPAPASWYPVPIRWEFLWCGCGSLSSSRFLKKLGVSNSSSSMPAVIAIVFAHYTAFGASQVEVRPTTSNRGKYNGTLHRGCFDLLVGNLSGEHRAKGLQEYAYSGRSWTIIYIVRPVAQVCQPAKLAHHYIGSLSMSITSLFIAASGTEQLQLGLMLYGSPYTEPELEHRPTGNTDRNAGHLPE